MLCPVCHAASLEPDDVKTIDALVDYDADYIDADSVYIADNVDTAEDWLLGPLSGFFHGVQDRAIAATG